MSIMEQKMQDQIEGSLHDKEPTNKDLPYDPDDYCDSCGSSTFWEDCWKCGGQGGRDGEDLMAEDPMWYSPNDFETCDVCNGKGGFNMCLNSDCNGEVEATPKNEA